VLAAKLALAGRVDGIVTAPLHKAALWEAGHCYPGHTELLAELCGVTDVAMMLYLAPGPRVLASGGLGVVHVTLHMALREVFEHLTAENIISRIRLADEVMRAMLPTSASGGRKPADRSDDAELRLRQETLGISGLTPAARQPRIGVCALNPHAGEARFVRR
jgi:4-hydroxy-L-threonine phosphate dehydrogenase PdxA